MNNNRTCINKVMLAIVACAMLSACTPQSIGPPAGHITYEPRPAGNIPKTVQQAASLQPPKPATKIETYSVVVNKVPVQELLFALARDAKVNVDIHPGIEGAVTLNALNQTLPQLLARIAKQVDMRYELDGPNLAVMPDSPFLRNYKVDYLNISRDAISNVSIATQIQTAGSGAGTTASGTGNNNSTTSVTNKSNNRFWETLTQNLKDILRETDKILPEGSSETTTEQAGNQSTTGTGAVTAPVQSSSRSGSSQTNLAGSPKAATITTDNITVTRRTTFREASSVIANPENGLLSVRATGRQHEKIREFIDQIMASAKRQVLIEATVVEVRLSDQYQQGINWSGLRIGTDGFKITQGGVGTLPTGVIPGVSPGIFILNYANPVTAIGNIAATIQLLESFGNVKVLSSPKINVLNNQTAMLKVVDNKVYFTINVTITPATATSAQLIVYNTIVNTVPVGFVMSVTPQIDETDTVTLNVRPTISRITGYVNDPSPPLAEAGVVSRIPEIQTREIESILKVGSGQIAVMGGLMQDSVDNLKDGIPGLSSLPIIGNVFSYRNETSTKSELVIFLRPIVVKDAGLDGDYKDYSHFLPGESALKAPYSAAPSQVMKP
ncbi:pilus (MSHA type) biogenesis protein MshL [Propionivibrio sp.]|uniref:pilus (MSHA type) biogenesis protein MshL n=1 Tax=Propionivibrio sp. TaxID=2212460 RepID=UPI003BF264D0